MKTFTFCLHMLIASTLFAQNVLDLSFTGDHLGEYTALDSILIKNLTQGGDTLLYAPDSVLQLQLTGNSEITSQSSVFLLEQNTPNPFRDITHFTICMREKSHVEFRVTEISGRTIINQNVFLDFGKHTFRFYPGKEKICFLTALAGGQSMSIKMIHTGNSNVPGKMEYADHAWHQPYKSQSSIAEFIFSPGDQLLMVGYSQYGESGFVKVPMVSTDCVFQFGSNVPCPGADSIQYEGQWYHTIQVFSQCWFRENLNVGEMIVSSQGQANNSVIEKYCMADESSMCDLYGGMYTWTEMMNYAGSIQQGICPEGWHVPTDWDWKILEGTVDSENGIGDPVWNGTDWRGLDAGANLKQEGTQYWWSPNTGTDAYGFRALPGGYFVDNSFWGVGYRSIFWSADHPSYSMRIMDAPESGVRRLLGTNFSGDAFSMRCIKNQE